MSQATLALAAFFVTYALIVSEKMHRTTAALLGAAVVIVGGVLEQGQAVRAIDFNTLGLLIGMMMLVRLTGDTGVFEYTAIKVAKLAGGHPWRSLAGLALVTAGASALLDNVTTVLLIVPVTLKLARELKTDPMPFLLSEILASNIGGTATLIGDPPNILIGSATGLSFMDFLLNLGPVIAVVLGVSLVGFYLVWGRGMRAEAAARRRIMDMDERAAIRDSRLLRKAGIVLALTMVGFFLHAQLHLESATVALGGAALLLAWSGKNVDHVLHGVEWPTIFFFIGLFVVVGAVESTGLLAQVAAWVMRQTGGDMNVTTAAVLWLSAVASGVVDNIPFVATMIPVIQAMGQVAAAPLDQAPLWWALSLGACLGGNGTLVGASANVVVADMAADEGHRIGFGRFLRVGVPFTLIAVLISWAYLHMRYLA